jgi:hypothetical protein
MQLCYSSCVSRCSLFLPSSWFSHPGIYRWWCFFLFFLWDEVLSFKWELRNLRYSRKIVTYVYLCLMKWMVNIFGKTSSNIRTWIRVQECDSLVTHLAMREFFLRFNFLDMVFTITDVIKLGRNWYLLELVFPIHVRFKNSGQKLWNGWQVSILNVVWGRRSLQCARYLFIRLTLYSSCYKN